jgi:ABC-type sugar transport system ATPase subunit
VPELDRVSDRCLVLGAGQLVATLQGPSLSEDNILACAVTQVPVQG